MKFEVIDIDGPNKFEFIGSVETTMSALVGGRINYIFINLKIFLF